MDLSRRTDLSPAERAGLAQDFHVLLLDAMSRHGTGLAGRMMFHGGTSLATCHGSPRWSEDLDFVATVDMARELSAARDAIEGELRDAIGDMTPGARVELQDRGRGKTLEEGGMMRWLLRWEHPRRIGAVKVKAELFLADPAQVADYATFEARPAHGGVETRNAMPAARLETIWSDKIVAISARPAMKWRDLFDLAWVTERLSPDTMTDEARLERIRVTAAPYRDSLPDIRSGLDRDQVVGALEDLPTFEADLANWIDPALFAVMQSRGDVAGCLSDSAGQVASARRILDAALESTHDGCAP